MKVVIFGANSFLARNFIVYLKRERGDVSLLLYDYTPLQIDGFAPYRQVDPCDFASVSEIDFSADLIFDFVGKTGTWKGFDEIETYLDVNEKALLHLLNAYRKANSHAKIIYPSTRLVYRGREGKLKENASKEGKTIYAINKLACESYLEAYRNAFGVSYCIFRICVPYASFLSGSSYGTAEFMLKRAQAGEDICLFGGGAQRRTFTHIEDLCRQLWQGALLCDCGVYNVGGEDLSLKEVASLIAKRYSISVKDVPWEENAKKIESGDTVFDAEKLEQIIGKQTYHSLFEWVEQL